VTRSRDLGALGSAVGSEAGDWYARRMYIEGDAAYKFHLEHYGHPSKVGFKDVIPLFKAEKWTPSIDGSVCERRREIFREHGRASR